MDTQILKLCITIDIDNDWIIQPNENIGKLKWDGFEKGLKLVLDQVEKWSQAVEVDPLVTIFPRADYQIKQEWGKTSYLFFKLFDLLYSFRFPFKIEYGWHPHLNVKQDNGWQFDHNEARQYDQLLEIYHELNQEISGIVFSRIGECKFSNAIWKGISDCGIKIDSTALPGRQIGETDWRNSPVKPYYPLESNYLLAGGSTVIEVPMTTMKIHAPYEKIPKYRYLNINFNKKYFGELGRIIKDRNEIVTITHPYEVLGTYLEIEGRHQLWGHANSIYENLSYISQLCAENNKICVCASLNDLVPTDE